VSTPIFDYFESELFPGSSGSLGELLLDVQRTRSVRLIFQFMCSSARRAMCVSSMKALLGTVCLPVTALLCMSVATPLASAQTAHLLGVTSTLGSGFSGPEGVAVDSSGNIYFAETNNNDVKKIQYTCPRLRQPFGAGAQGITTRPA
jgi:DNA-binding beta-propeller fold protein YncE